MRSWTRRDLLTTFLGLPAATLAGCRAWETENIPLPEGRIVGPSTSVGHQVRDGLSVTPSEDRWQTVRVVIVGGGVAGYSAARRLLQAGIRDFVLLELEAAPGGKSRSGRSEVVSYPWGAHYLPVPLKENRPLLQLLDEMGVLEGRDEIDEAIVSERFLCREPAERLFVAGRWHEGIPHVPRYDPDEQAQFQTFNRLIDDWVSWRDRSGRRAFALPVDASSDDPEVTQLDRITMTDWLLQHDLHSPTLRWFIDYCCRDDYGTTADHTSAWAGVFYFAARIRRPGEASQPYITWPEGNGRLISHLHRMASTQGDVRLGLAVTDIIPQEAGAAGVDVIAVENDALTAFGFHAERVIFSVPQFLCPYLFRPPYRPPHLTDFEYSAWMVANLHLEGRPRERGLPMCWDNVLYDSPSLGYVAATHQTGRDSGPTVLTYYYPLCDEDPREARRRLFTVDWQGWAEITLSDLERAHPDLRRLVRRLDIMQWGHAMVRPRPGLIWGESRRQAMRPHCGVHFAHSDLSGMPLFEEAFHHGLRAAEEVLVAMNVPFTSVLACH